MPTKHPTPPTPEQGAITVWAEREHAVSAFRISAPAGAVQVLDLDLRDVLPAANPAAVEDALGQIYGQSYLIKWDHLRHPGDGWGDYDLR